jgi:hypothetical protein
VNRFIEFDGQILNVNKILALQKDDYKNKIKNFIIYLHRIDESRLFETYSSREDAEQRYNQLKDMLLQKDL